MKTDQNEIISLDGVFENFNVSWIFNLDVLFGHRVLIFHIKSDLEKSSVILTSHGSLRDHDQGISNKKSVQ